MNSIIIWFILKCIAFILAVLIAIITYRNKNKIIMWISIIAAVVALVLALLVNNVPIPTIHRESDHSAIIISTNESMQIEYKIATDTYSDDDWVEYKEPLTLEKSAIIYARAKTLWFTSPETSRVAYLLDNGLVYFSDVEKPRESVLSISATYNYKEPENGQAGNHYAGYEIKKEDISVTGITVEGEEKEITNFSYSPRSLAKNINTVKVEYAITDETSLVSNLNVIGDSPKLIKLSAKYTGDNVYLDSVLDSNDFSVKGIYEDGTQKDITGYSVSPVEVKEGKNKITISKDNLSCVVEVYAVDRDTISENEVEPNNEISTANDIDTNIKYSGTLKDEDDEDYYKIFLREKGKIIIKLTHPKLDDNGDFWVASLLSQNKEPIVELTSSGKNVETVSSPARVAQGVYYLKVSKYYYSDEKYTISAVFETEDDSYEDEPNDDLSSNAMSISLDKEYTGNLTAKDDVDYYKFSLSEKRKVWIDFSHQKTSINNPLWTVSLLGDAEGSIIEFEASGENASIVSNCARLPAGNYYFKVKSYYWSDIDYSFCVNSQKEGDEAESENNNDYGTATKLALNTSIIGNIQSEKDVDFYRIEIKNTASINVSFSHNQFDSRNTYWKLDLYSENSSSAIQNDEKQTTLEVQGDTANSVSSYWSSLTAGVYYLKVYKNYYCNDDYTITISN